MVAGCGAKLSKMILFVFNFLVWLVGIILIGLGGFVLARPDKYSSFFGSNANSLNVVCGVIIGVGCLVFLLAFAGCCGAIKESACLLKVYIAVLLLLVILEIVGGILAIVFRDSIKEIMDTEMKRQIKEDYKYTVGKKTVLDLLQEEGKCCGSTSYKDWAGSKFQTTTITKFVPLSCCKDQNTGTCNNANLIGDDIQTKDDIYVTGCIDAAIEQFKQYFLIIGAVAISMVVAEILAMIFACCVISGINHGEYA